MTTKRISQLPLATVITGAELVPVVQAGETKRATIDVVWEPVRNRSHGATWATSLGGEILAPVKATTEIPGKCQILSYNIITQGGTGSCVIDIWKRQKPTLPTAAQSICGSNKPTITNAVSLFSANFAGWTTIVLQAGDLVTFNLESNSFFNTVAIQLMVEGIA